MNAEPNRAKQIARLMYEYKTVLHHLDPARIGDEPPPGYYLDYYQRPAAAAAILLAMKIEDNNPAPEESRVILGFAKACREALH